MKIFGVQNTFLPGKLKHNKKIILERYGIALNTNCNICILPELSLPGYTAKDLFLQDRFLLDIHQLTLEIALSSKSTMILIPTAFNYQTMLSIYDEVSHIPTVIKDDKLYNVAIMAINGKITGIVYKYNLPNDSVFAESRYFSIPKSNPSLTNIFQINGSKVGILICEDIWHISTRNAVSNVDFVIIINASPFEKDKMAKRIDVVSKLTMPIFYLNQVGGHDHIVFDGYSFIKNGISDIAYVGNGFLESDIFLEFKNRIITRSEIYRKQDRIRDIISAIVIGIKSYLRKTNFSQICFGLSGGIDSALVSTLATLALKPEFIHPFMLPSEITSISSIEDAKLLCRNIALKLDIISIENILPSIMATLPSIDQVGYGNIQSRLRSLMLMCVANQYGYLLLSCSNKSELATGYATLYGDTCGALAPIQDLYKTEVYEISRYLNNHYNELYQYFHGEKCEIKNIIPLNILKKEPTAELQYNQSDMDRLPPYPILDAILYKLIEMRMDSHNVSFCQEEIAKIVYRLSSISYYRDTCRDAINKLKETVHLIETLLHKNEFKRKQSPIGIKISSLHLGSEWRFDN